MYGIPKRSDCIHFFWYCRLMCTRSIKEVTAFTFFGIVGLYVRVPKRSDCIHFFGIVGLYVRVPKRSDCVYFFGSVGLFVRVPKRSDCFYVFWYCRLICTRSKKE